MSKTRNLHNRPETPKGPGDRESEEGRGGVVEADEEGKGGNQGDEAEDPPPHTEGRNNQRAMRPERAESRRGRQRMRRGKRQKRTGTERPQGGQE